MRAGVVAILVLGACGEEQPEPVPAPTSVELRGVVRYVGEPPAPREIRITEPGCAAELQGPVYDPFTIVNDGRVPHALVWVEAEFPEGTFPEPPEEAVLAFRLCMIEPPMLPVIAGQVLEIRHEDGNFTHLLHGRPRRNGEYGGVSQSVGQVDRSVRLRTPEPPFQVNCDVHDWERGFIAVFAHPLFSVSGEDGSFAIAGVPSGTYQVRVWHPEFGEASAQVTVPGSGAVEFTLP